MLSFNFATQEKKSIKYQYCSSVLQGSAACEKHWKCLRSNFK